MRTNILLELKVKNTSRYRGDYKSAIDEAYELSKEMNIGVNLNYLNQYLFTILPTMTIQEIIELKKTKVIIGV